MSASANSRSLQQRPRWLQQRRIAVRIAMSPLSVTSCAARPACAGCASPARPAQSRLMPNGGSAPTARPIAALWPVLRRLQRRDASGRRRARPQERLQAQRASRAPRREPPRRLRPSAAAHRQTAQLQMRHPLAAQLALRIQLRMVPTARPSLRRLSDPSSLRSAEERDPPHERQVKCNAH